ncbi:MAG: membrane protein [Hyphobacterium sp.]|nr:MAG: membrane protein [Hyphobacterium sp.]
MPLIANRTGNWRPSKRLNALILCLFLIACARETEPAPQPNPDPPAPVVEETTALQFEILDWSEIPDWENLSLESGFAAFSRSCVALGQMPGDLPMSVHHDFAGRVSDWQTACRLRDDQRPRQYFETAFVPVRVRLGITETGLLTGYYEPELDVRRAPGGEFTQAIRSRPAELISADLGVFSDQLAGQRLMGRVEGNRFIPYRDRAEIEAVNAGEILAWGRPIDVFFLQIQGSGRLVFGDGETRRAAFAAHNGQPYVSIGRELVSRGELELHQASKSGIEAWLNQNGPEASRDLFAVNPRYIFFGLEPLPDPDLGPRGAAGLPLTPMASVAVDPAFLPYGVPVILGADLPGENAWRGLVITQDTGGAIRGPMRGDLFYGWGQEAERRAGSTRSDASWIVFLPRAVATALVPPS